MKPDAIARRVCTEFIEMPGLRLTLRAHTGKESNTEGQQAEASTQ